MTDTEPTPIDVVEGEPGATAEKADLGRRMGMDAQRVARGELSEDKFYEKYHEEVVEEFGFDKRPGGETA